MRGFSIGLGLVLCAVVATAARASVDLRPVPIPGPRTHAWRALALDPTGTRLAVGHARGVFVVQLDEAAVPLGSGPGGAVEQWRTESVSDLTFDAESRLWIATASGLWLVDRDRALIERSPGPGEATRRIRSVAASRGLIVAGTAAGAHLADLAAVARSGAPAGAEAAVRWLSLAPWLPSGPVADVALAAAGDSGCAVEGGNAHRVRLWIAIGSAIRRLELAFAEGEWRVESATGVTGLPTDATPVALAIGATASEVVAVYPHRLALVRDPAVTSNSAPWNCANAFDALRRRGSQRATTAREAAGNGRNEPRAQIERPVLAPGTLMRDLVYSAGRWWLSTDRGLFVGESLSGPWLRQTAVRTPVDALAAGSQSVLADSVGEDATAPRAALWLISQSELHRADAGALRASPTESASTSLSVMRPGPERASSAASEAQRGSRMGPARRGPELRHVQSAALRYLSLEREPFARLARGLARRGWLPEVDLSGGYSRDDSRRRDDDQSFVSGAMRRLQDQSWDSGSDWDVSASLSWDLRELFYPTDAVDLSREARQVIALRDDVLDEIAQLYYERLALLIQLDGEALVDFAARTRAELRVEELAAGLDGWTGGWFSAQLQGPSSTLDCATIGCGLEAIPEK